ncbi:MAG: S41 family peptidase [Eubacteriales bacterium]|nr:S41 family peptidase [Eubacteriales bacterium]
MKRPDSSTISLAICILIIAILTFSLAFVLNERSGEKIIDVSAVQDLAETIRSEYFFYDDKELDEDKLVDSAMRGMIDTLDDPYAQYYTEDEYNKLLSANAGDYVGVGISVQVPDDTGSTVISVYDGGPADLAGIRPGDIITKINGKATANLSMDELVACFSEDDAVPDEITFLRDGAEQTVTVQRSEVHVDRVDSKLLSGKVGYIRITEFNGSVADDFWNSASSFRDQGVQNLIIDLRDNPGGGLNEVLQVANHLVPKDQVLVTIRSKSGNERVYRSEGSDQLNMNLVVLVNGNSASASELLTGALKDYGLATIVGVQTFGKGIVQSFYRIKENGGWAKFTTDAYYTPNDICIQGIGITPDIVVTLPDELQNTSIELLDPAKDTQLQAAMSVFAQQAGAPSTVNR